MWILKYYFDIWNHLRGNEVKDLYSPLKTLSDSEKTKVLQLFENTIDQQIYDTSDYNRLKNCLIDWYTSLKTVVKTQEKIVDPFSLPDSDLDELFRSFGWNYSKKLSVLSNEINQNKVNFFLDLVNLYKIKGSPEGLMKVLSYHGIPDCEVYEYFIEKNPDHVNKLIFSGTKAAFTGREIVLPRPVKLYDIVTNDDPHWMYNEEELIYHINHTTKIGTISKSPYFSLKIYYDLINTQSTMAIIARKINDEYYNWKNNNVTPDQTTFISYFGIYTSFTELYLTLLYIFNYRHSPRTHIPERYSFYTDTNPEEYNSIIQTYDKNHRQGLYEYTDPITGETINRKYDRTSRKIKLQEWYDKFSQPFNLDFIKTPEDVEKVLKEMNPSLKSKVDEIIDIYPFVNLYGPFMEDLQTWMISYMGPLVSRNLAYLMLGEEEFTRNLGPLINFFKPYHARLISVDMALKIEDRLTDSTFTEDGKYEKVVENVFDWVTCDGAQCCPDQQELCGDADSHYSRSTYDCGSFYDVGATCDVKENAHKLTITDYPIDKLTCRNTIVTDEPHEQITFVEDPITHKFHTVRTVIEEPERHLLHEFVENENYISMPGIYYGETGYMITSGGFPDFDCGGCFDSQYANDICKIIVVNH